MESDGSEGITPVAVDGKLGRSPSWSSSSSPPLCLCRICHEEEEESTAGMEAPCACAGTLKVDSLSSRLVSPKIFSGRWEIDHPWLSSESLRFLPSSLHTGDASSGGATRREAQSARYACRSAQKTRRHNPCNFWG